MTAKAWKAGDIRDLARKTVDGKNTTIKARGNYFRALLETAQAELGGSSGQSSQRVAVKAAHRRFYPIVQEAIATDEVILADGFTRKEVALERNRRLNFARSSYGTIQRWLRAPGHDLMKLDTTKVSKSQLEKDAPPARPHQVTPERLQARAGKLVDGLVGLHQQVAKTDRALAATLLREAMDRLFGQISSGATATTDAHVAVQEGRLLRVGKTLFLPTEISHRKAA